MKKILLLAAGVSFISLTSSAQFWDYSEPKRLPGTLNTETGEESIPVFSKDSSILFFVRTFDPSAVGGESDQDIWFSKREEDGSYGGCQRLTDINNKYNNAVLGLGKGGSVMYVLNSYEGKKDLVKGIAASTKKGAGWSKPEEVIIPTLDIEGDFYGFHVNEAENVIIISYAGPGTLGQEDLYVSTKEGAGWSAPIHMGNTLNTSGFEISPFLSKTQDTLYFSSNGHGGQGDADIFYSVIQGSWSSWSKPTNLGSKINSPKFDAYFSHSGNMIYWSSNRESERSDIYTAMVIFPPALVATCSATDATKYEGSDGSIVATIEGGVPPYSYSWSNGVADKDLINIMKGEYSLTVTDSRGKSITTSCIVNEPAPLELPVITAATYKNIEFMHYFDYNKNKLSVDKGTLKKFVKSVEVQLKAGRPNITINVYSSASKVPTKTYETNEKLTQIRAENMKYDLSTYFESKDDFKGKVNVVVVSAIVDGPDYVEDAQSVKKYRPYQFVGLKTE
jgi:hypothetical protein